MSDATDGGTGRDERTLRDELLAARLADLVIATRLASHSASAAAAAAARMDAALGAYFHLAGATEPTTAELQSAQRRALASLGRLPEKADAAPPKPRIITDERDAPGC